MLGETRLGIVWSKCKNYGVVDTQVYKKANVNDEYGTTPFSLPRDLQRTQTVSSLSRWQTRHQNSLGTTRGHGLL